MSTDIRLDDSTSAAIAAIAGGAQKFVEALAGDIRDRFRDNVHVVTGALQASASVITPSGSDYGPNVAAASALDPKASFAPEATVGPNEAVVQLPIDHATYAEFGRVAAPAHPALVPAVEAAVANADAIARAVFKL